MYQCIEGNFVESMGVSGREDRAIKDVDVLEGQKVLFMNMWDELVNSPISLWGQYQERCYLILEMIQLM